MEGDKVVLVCPIELSGTFEWLNYQQLRNTTRISLLKGSKILVIYPVRIVDAGVFQCIVHHGHIIITAFIILVSYV